jgi:hypothetical protein
MPRVKKTTTKKVVEPEPAEPVTPEPDPIEPESVPEPLDTTVQCEGFSTQFAALALTMPPSVRKQVANRLEKKYIDPLADADETTSETIRSALQHAYSVYERKRIRASLAAAKKRDDAKAAAEPIAV